MSHGEMPKLKPRSFEYIRAESLEDVFQVLDEQGDEAKIIAGGQSLMAAMNMRFAAPETLVDVADIIEMRGIHLNGDMLRIGAMSRHSEVLASEDVATHAPIIFQAMPQIAHPAIRNRGTFGGSLCNADPASELPACALAAQAIFNIQSSVGSRSVAAVDFLEGTYATCLKANEVLISVDVPIATANTRTFFDEVARRHGDFAMAGIAAQAEISGGVIGQASLVYFAVSEMALRSDAASAMIEGQRIDDLDVEAVCDALAIDIHPFEDLTTSGEAKMHLLKVLTRRALAALTDGQG